MAKGRSKKSNVQGSEAIQAPGWPTRRLKNWPLPSGYKPKMEKKRISNLGYQKVVGAVRALFTDPAMADTIEGLQDFCFQQGGISNANPRDRAFFFDVLSHDLVFFEGDRGRPLIEDLPLDPKVYDALPHMRSSHFDIYRVEKRSLFGGATVRSLLRDVELKTGVRPLRGPLKESVVLGRVVQIGRGTFMDDPLFVVEDGWLPEIRGTFTTELERARARHPGVSAESFLKVGGYHLYEAVAAASLRAELEGLVGETTGLDPIVVRFRVRKRRDLPDLRKLSGGRVVEEENGKAAIVMVDLAPEARIHKSVREAMVSIDDKDVLVLAFVRSGSRELLAEVASLLPETVHRTDEVVSPATLYRSLRHTLAR